MNANQTLLYHLTLSSHSDDPPFLTDDPVVNHAVDQHKEDCRLTYNEELYQAEIESWKNSGGLLLSLKQE